MSTADETTNKSCWARVKHRLITHEDPIHLHKTLGILSLVHFFYRYAYVYPKKGNLGFVGSKFDWMCMFLHLFLSSSSLIFHVLPRRMASRPMMIWNEYRLHAIVFTIRCFLVYCFSTYRPFKDTPFESVLLYCCVMVNHVVADEITRRYEGNTGTTVRGSKPNHEWFVILGMRLYALYQFLAIASHLTPNEHMGDLGFNTLIAIQSSAFLMTLFRKALIKWYSHAFWYSMCLALSTYHIFHSVGSYTFFAKVLFCFALRVKGGVNKYAIWGLFALSTINFSQLAASLKNQGYHDQLSMLDAGIENIYGVLAKNSLDNLLKF